MSATKVRDCPQCYWNGGIEDVGLPPPPGTHDPSACPERAPAAPPRPCPGITNLMTGSVQHCDGCPGCTTHAPHAPEAGRLTEEMQLPDVAVIVADPTRLNRYLDSFRGHARLTTPRMLVGIIDHLRDRLTKEQP